MFLEQSGKHSSQVIRSSTILESMQGRWRTEWVWPRRAQLYRLTFKIQLCLHYQMHLANPTRSSHSLAPLPPTSRKCVPVPELVFSLRFTTTANAIFEDHEAGVSPGTTFDPTSAEDEQVLMVH